MPMRPFWVLSFNSSQIYRSHICTLVRERRWSCSFQCGLLEMWRTGSGMLRNLWRPHWGIILTAHSKSTLRSATLCFLLLDCLSVQFQFEAYWSCPVFCKIFICSLYPSATSGQVGVILARSSGDSRLSGLLDCWGVWGLGAGSLDQPPLSPTTDTGVHLVLD